MKTRYMIFVWLCAVGLMSACEDKEVVTTGAVTGSITDAGTNAALSDVAVKLTAKSASVTMDEQVQQSTYSGNFAFKNLQSGRYILAIDKEGYLPASGEILVLGNEVEMPCTMVRDTSYNPEVPDDPKPIYPDVYVGVEHNFTLADGIYFYFKPSVGVSYYFWDFWKANEVPASEEKIINSLILDGVRVEVDGGEEAGYGYNLQPNTLYKYYILAYNKDKVRGKRLISGEITTSSNVNQPVATIELNSSVMDTVYLKVKKNSYCSSYYMSGVNNITTALKEKPDIWWAGNYFYDSILAGETQDISHTSDFNGKWWRWPLVTDNIILTWGKNAKGELSGVLTKKEFRLPLDVRAMSLPMNTLSAKKPGRAQTDASELLRLKGSAEVIVPYRTE